MTALAENWLGAEPLLIERLQSLKGAGAGMLRAIYTASELEALEAPSDPRASALPALHVLYAGDQLVDTTDNGEASVIDQIWCLAIVASNSRGAEALRADVGPLVPKVVDRVAGWDCGLLGLRPFRRARISSMPRFNSNKKAIYPLFFAARAFA